jgi:uncharacterized membrane protein
MEYLKLGLIILILDAIYVAFVASKFGNMIKNIQNKAIDLRYGSIIVCYILITFALNHFIIQPNKPITDAFLLGICIYGVFDTVSFAIFKKWSLSLTIIDALWGGVLFSLATYIYRKL